MPALLGMLGNDTTTCVVHTTCVHLRIMPALLSLSALVMNGCAQLNMPALLGMLVAGAALQNARAIRLDIGFRVCWKCVAARS